MLCKHEAGGTAGGMRQEALAQQGRRSRKSCSGRQVAIQAMEATANIRSASASRTLKVEDLQDPAKIGATGRASVRVKVGIQGRVRAG